MKGVAPRDATPGAQPVGPRAASASSAWEAPEPQGNDLNAITCMDVDACIAVGDAGTVLVRSAGGSWTSVSTGIADDLLGVDCATDGPCVAVGRNGVGLRSTDGGQTWARASTASSRTLRAVSCPSPTMCVAVGDDGKIERSDNGGASWSTMSTLSTERLAGYRSTSARTSVTRKPLSFSYCLYFFSKSAWRSCCTLTGR